MVKSEIRILGIDDGAFVPRSKAMVPVIGVVFRGGKFFDGVLKTEVAVDGDDATAAIVKLINNSRHKQQLKVLMLDGITVGGFNVIDIKSLHAATNIPVIVVNRKKPDVKNVKKGLKHFEDFEKRWDAVKNAGKIKEFVVKDSKKIFYQSVGMNDSDAEEVIRLSCTHSYLPEPLRAAHLIATAVASGESKGRA
jgi:hypothetical protein